MPQGIPFRRESMDIFRTAEREEGLTREEIREALVQSLQGRTPRRALILPPDYTRYHSNAGFITNVYYHLLVERGAEVDIMPALGTHAPMTEAEAADMFGDVPFGRFLVHNRSEEHTSELQSL